MNETLTDSRVANLGARLIYDAFHLFHADFRLITQRARHHFENRDWHALSRDSNARIDLYGEIVHNASGGIRHLLSWRVRDKLVWASIKAVYSGLISARDDWEIAETFLNSVTRRIFTTVGVDRQIEFVDTDFDTPPSAPKAPILKIYHSPTSIESLVDAILADFSFSVAYEDRRRDAREAADAIVKNLDLRRLPHDIEKAELLLPVFYRGQRAFLIGRFWAGPVPVPLVLALTNPCGSILVDAVLCDEDDISILFSFTHSYFLVDAARPHALVSFLHELMPQKRIAELYIAIGHNRHGKTEFYRHLLHHLQTCDEQFILAPGVRGMVMLVFTLPSYDVVCKIIRETFEEPKRATRADVMQKYSLVFKHDRAGRLIDAQEFEHLEFDASRFSTPLLQEMKRLTSDSVAIEGNRISIRHLYLERRVHPLDLFVRQADESAVAQAVIDYGQSLKDLAAANIFPGDLLLKNFGVTRHGRVVFYDYDELCLLTGCNFRRMPRPVDAIDEMSAEPWFYVGEDDCFPAEFRIWLGFQEPWRSLFAQHHGDLFDVDFWQETQKRIQSGEVIDILPYPQSRRLSHELTLVRG